MLGALLWGKGKDINVSTEWHFLRTKDDLPKPRNNRKVLTWYGRNMEDAHPVILDADRFDVGGAVIAWREITPPKE